MGSHETLPSRLPVVGAMALLILLAALGLDACGGANTTRPTSLPPRSTPVAAAAFPPEQKPLGGDTEASRGGTGGLVIVPWVDIEVSALGFYDYKQDGLRSDHKVVIYQDSSKRAVTPTVIVNSASELDGLFRYEQIEPVVLKAGETYVLAFLGDVYGDPGVDPKGLLWAPEIRYVGWRELDSTWGFPSRTWSFLDMSGNFRFLPVETAAPTTLP
jgi:hypothetical protein